MNLWQIAWRNLMRRKLRTFLTILSIVIGVASTFAVIASVDTAKTVFPLYLKAAFGKADFQVYGTEPYFPEDVYREVGSLKPIESVAILKENTKLHLEKEGIAAIQKRVDLIGYSRLDSALTNFKLIKGSLTSDGAVITDRTAKVWKADVGDTISFDTDEGIRHIQISAIVRYTVELMGPSSWMMAKYHPWSVAVPLSTVQDWFDLADQIETIHIRALPGTDPDAAGRQVDEMVQRFGNIYMQPVVLDFETQFKEANSFFLTLYIAGLLGIALSALIIFNSLYVSVKERKNEFAALKTIGYTPEQMRTFVLFEVMLLSIIGTAVGLLLGYGMGIGLKALIFLMFSVYDDSGMKLVNGLVVSILAGLLVPIAAALYPIRQAGKVSVIESLKENRANEAGKLRKWQLLAGLLLIASGFFIKHLLLVLPIMIGIVLVFPFLFNLFMLLLKPVYRLIFGFSGELAARNLKRNLGRTSMTSVILCLGIAMIVLVSSLNSAFLQTYEKVIFSTYGGNLDIHFHHVEKTDVERLKQIEGVADAQTYSLQSVVWSLNDQKRKLSVYGVGADWIDRFPLFASTGQSPGELIRSLKDDEIVLDNIAFGVWGGNIGESVWLSTLQGVKAFKVVAVVDTMKNNGYGAFVKTETFKESFGLKYEHNALVLKDESVSALQLRERIFDAFGERAEEMFGPEDWVTVIGAVYTGSFSVINALLILSIVISGIGIANTLLMTIMERIRELGMMRAVGVTRRQVLRMVLLEGAGIGLAAAVAGCALGIWLIYLTSTFMEIHSLTYAFEVSWKIVLLTGGFGVAVSLVSSFAPASKAAKTRLSEALRYE